MDAFGFTPSTFARNVIMDVLYRIGHVDGAIKVLKETQFPNFLTFNITLCNLCKLGDLSNMKHISRRMLQQGYYPNVNTFKMLLNCLCKMGRLAEAYQVLGLMITLGVSVSIKVWSILIDVFCQLHQPYLAYALFNKMLRTGCSPNLVIYTNLIKGFLDSKMVNTASSILNRMESDGYVADLVLCNILIDCLSKGERYDDAFGIFLSLPDRKLVPDSYTFCSLLSNICLFRRFSLLPNIASGLAIEGDLMVCNSLLNYFCKAGYPLHAVELYDYMLDRGLTPDKYSFVGLLSGLCGAGKINKAVGVYQGLIMSYCGLDAHVHTAIMDRLIRVAFNQLVEMWKSGLIPDEAMYAHFFKGPASGIYIAHAQRLLVRDKVWVDSSSFDDLPDVAASVG
ncbi:Detected protein of confused Function [Hibiscus syriacus]|uniref:Detected protein of confused Function n=1 Tax=Hibiscus syriacus TaxID=106335 RepID=A0A6A2ZIM2_HIBSY|nr:Detected protein of confused Function [Hibiscus syriacus]